MKSIHFLSSPINIFFLLLWLSNDLFLKAAYPGWLTGKLSDLLGVYLSPFVITAFLYFLYPKKEDFLFKISLLITGLLFISVNLNQNLTDFLYHIPYPLLHYRGTADLTDLPCLFILFLSVYSYERKTFTPKKRIQSFSVLILSAFTFINSPAPERDGDGKLGALLILLGHTRDAIYQIDPIQEKKVSKEETFHFRFVSRANESKPSSIESLVVSNSCTDVNAVPIDTPYTKSSSTYPSMKFNQYRIEISSLSDKNKEKKIHNCLETSCTMDTSDLESGSYTWEVKLEYLYEEECKIYRYIRLVDQDKQTFTK